MKPIKPYTLGSDDGLIPCVSIDRLSSYMVDGVEFMDFCLTDDGYSRLKEHFFELFKEEESNND